MRKLRRRAAAVVLAAAALIAVTGPTAAYAATPTNATHRTVVRDGDVTVNSNHTVIVGDDDDDWGWWGPWGLPGIAIWL